MQNLRKIIAYLFLAVTLSLFSFGAPSDASTEKLIAQVSKKIPKGWTVSFDAEHSWLKISRDESFLGLQIVPNMSGYEKVKLINYSLCFRVIEKISKNEYHRRIQENTRTREELRKLYDQLRAKRVNHKFDSFSPNTDEDRVLVDRYNSLKKSLHRLPDFHFESISLSWGFGTPDDVGLFIKDEEVREECDAVSKSILSILKSYEANHSD